MRKYFLLSILSLPSTCLHAQEIKAVKLKQEHISYSPRNFYVSAVKDDRQDTSSLGIVRVGLANKKALLTLKNGVANSINDFIQNNVDQNRSAYPVELHIVRLDVGEKNIGGREQADVTFSISFYRGDTKLVDYTGSNYVQSGIDVTGYIERLIRDDIGQGIRDFDKWLDNNKDALNPSAKPKANRELKVTVVIQDDPADTDLIYYNKNRPLKREDFEAEPDDLNLGAAATYSAIGMKYLTLTQDNVVDLKVVLSASFDKTKSWWRGKLNTKDEMEHEQHHFDITALKTCELAEAVKHAALTADNFTKELEALQKKAVKDMQAEQNLYDKETKHNLIKTEQARWNKEISAQVAQMSCY